MKLVKVFSSFASYISGDTTIKYFEQLKVKLDRELMSYTSSTNPGLTQQAALCRIHAAHDRARRGPQLGTIGKAF